MKLAVVGTGKIVCEALPVLAAVSGIEVRAICSRPESAEKAASLASGAGIGKIYSSYEELLGSGCADTVYLGIVNSLHYKYAQAALEAGLSVICEKPFTSTADELDGLIETAAKKKLFLFEAASVLFSPPLALIRERLRDLGQIRLVQCSYSQFSSRYKAYLEGEVLPVFDPRYSGGALYDLNVYNLHYVCALFGRPASVSYHARRGPNGIDTSGVLVLDYPGFAAVCSAAKDSSGPSFVIVQGEEGWLEIVGPPNNPVGIRGSIAGQEVLIDLSTAQGSGEHRMAAEFRAFEEIVKNNNYDECARLLKHSRLVMQILTRARRDAGIVFAADRS